MTFSLQRALRLGILAVVASILPAAEVGDISIFQRYTALNPRIAQAGQAVTARRFPEAHRLLESCLQKVPDHFEAHFLLARMAYEDRDYAGALAHVETCERSLADLDRRYRAEAADLKAQDAAQEQAFRDDLSELNARGSNDPGWCCEDLLLNKKNTIGSLEAKKGHLYDRENPFAVPVADRFLHGNCLYRLGRRDEALAQYRLAVQADPTHANAWNNLIALLLEARDLPSASAELARAEAAHVVIQPERRKAVLGISPR
jgi:tetratricopeptide (TPR) repeat protein